ncbi:acyl-phosphate glycerol 3-phosphate acyltransferase [candidate division WOR-1 bacterium RIFOXYB2_FULL_48_7]|uniref:Glycerol-3-phosphate acyltransferase n=1 Tax=candidate division WOR-1 bacterium RIFOXYB2_FULL_48_7 TaxID=1802583 RepID=A0A1F4TXT6_UNCSA|nr:MAG: acyl-phosphate glycerol 3-phosphate acyltransferase [candidate division WOR-1 bacterium RIFOXYB2_FULL_48_7]
MAWKKLLKALFLLVVSYLLGSIPFSHLFPKKIKNRDVRLAGTKNVGATNALVVGGPLVGLLALIGDVAKGYLAVILARYFDSPDSLVALVAILAVIGHDFSIFLGFKGGKGVATTGGILLALDPIFTLITLCLWVLTMLVVRYFIPSTMIIFCFLPVLMWIGSWHGEYILFALINALLGLYAHRENLGAFFAGQELTIAEAIDKLKNKNPA